MDFDDHLFIKPKEKIFFEYLKHLSDDELCNLTELTKPSIFILGFPFDEGTKINNGRVGSENGPLAFRKALKEIKQLSVFESITNMSIYDIGNISQLDEHNKHLNLVQAYEYLKECVQSILNINLKYSIPFVVGGSNDQSFLNAKALLETCQNQSIAVINIDAHFDVRPLIKNKAHSGSPFRQLLEDTTFQNTKSFFIEFGSQGSQCSQDHAEYLKSKVNTQIIWLNKNIRRHKLCNNNNNNNNNDNNSDEVVFGTTQAGQIFYNLLQELTNQHQIQNIFVSFDLDSINSAYFSGVSSPSVIGGLTELEAIEIMLMSGLNSQVKLVDVSEYNPAVEGYRSGKLLAHMFFNFCKGVSQRKF